MTCFGFVPVIATKPSVPKKPCAGRSTWHSTGTREQVAALLLGRGQRVVERAHRIGRRRDRQHEVGERLHLRLGSGPVAAEQVREGAVELEERRALVARVDARHESAGAIAAPVHRAVRRHAAQRLGRERTLHRMEVRRRRSTYCRGSGSGSASRPPSGSPRSHARSSTSPKTWQLAHDASPLLDVERGVVEERPPRDDARRLRIVAAAPAAGLAPVVASSTSTAFVEARQDVEPAARLVEHEAARAAARDARCARDGVGRRTCPCLERGGVEHADACRAERRDVERRAVGR